MKKIITIFIILVTFNLSYSQKGETIAAAAGAVAGIIGGAIEYKQIVESIENEAVEWVLDNDTLKKFNLKLLQFNVSKKSEFNNISSISFIVRPEKFNESYVLLFVLSSGWISDYGLNFSYVQPLKLTREYWRNIMLTYLSLGGFVNLDDFNNIPTYSKTSKKISDEDFKNGNGFFLTNISSGGSVDVDMYYIDEGRVSLSQLIDVDRSKVQFKTKDRIRNLYLRKDLDGDTHFVKDFNNEIMIDFNELNLNMFLKSTSDLFTIKRNKVFEITKNLFCDSCFNNPFTKN